MNAIILNAIQGGGYVGIFLLMALENIFPPIPSEIIMGYGGVLVAQGKMDFVPLLLIGTLGTVGGNYLWFWLGSRWGEAQLQGFVDRHGRWLTMEWEDFSRAQHYFRRNGDWVVFFLRFSPFLRTIISLPAGLAKMKLWRFLLFTFLGVAGLEWLSDLGRQQAFGHDRTIRDFRRLRGRKHHRPWCRMVPLPCRDLEAAQRTQLIPLPRVGGAIGFQQTGGIDFRVDLRRTQAGMAEQLLQAAQIRTGT